MARTVLGVDIGYDTLKLALVSGRQVRKTAIVSMPSNLVREGRVVSTESMGELIRNTMRTNGIRCGMAAVSFPNETVFVRSVTMPQMTVDQLNYNLPFEFRDYITEELKDYVYDYAVVSYSDPSPEAGGDQSGATMELLAVAAPKSYLEETKAFLHKAGMKLVGAAPAICAFQGLIRAGGWSPEQEFCVLDLGYRSIRMYMFRGDRHVASRVLEIGLSTLDDVIAEAYNVDVHLAHTYLLTNYEDCQNKDYCLNAYGNITVELMRALNFYRFSNPNSRLEDIWICGGGAVIRALRQSIAEMMDLRIHEAGELIPGGAVVENDYALLQAIGIAMN